MKKRNITVNVREEDIIGGIPCGKLADLEDLTAYFKSNRRISYGWASIADSLNGDRFYLDIIENGKLLKTIACDIDMFREKPKVRWRWIW